MRSKRLLRALAIVAVMLGAGAQFLPSANADTPAMVSLVYVDFDKVVSDVDEGLNAQEKMKEEQKKRQTDIQAMELKIKKLQEDLDKKSKSFSKDALEKTAQEYQQALTDYQQIVMKFNNELSAKEREFFEPIERKVRDLLRAVALRDGYDMILAKRSVPYGRRDLDITEKVIQEYNKQNPTKKIAPATSSTAKPTASATTSAKPPTPKPSASVAPKMP
jgi:outer membrane protein